ncbi:unnamed protein product [Prunus armeniaca]|uniref:Uncharacterized protein n=1 Tax=Prunus armeniaca TaxID=36596 RepID=A0A6J5X5F0_PRUAR|nr:unnamed protein product [Prunus armeniaca]CAB4306294.1 unnamed protein product [Prunus armeniaca]
MAGQILDRPKVDRYPGNHILTLQGMFNFSFKNNQDETSFMYEITNNPIFPISMGVLTCGAS